MRRVGRWLAVGVALGLAACGPRAPRVLPSAEGAPQVARLGPTEQSAALGALGLDARALPRLDAVPKAVMKPLMDTFDDSLDACCEDCHEKHDPAAPTRAKRVTDEMWHRFTQDLVMADGSPVYCDSCHRGALRFLDRRDVEALRRWMRDNYVAGLRNRDGSAVACATCHGSPFEPRILDRLWRVAEPAPSARGSGPLLQ